MASIYQGSRPIRPYSWPALIRLSNDRRVDVLVLFIVVFFLFAIIVSAVT
jgi:hypothetical protein